MRKYIIKNGIVEAIQLREDTVEKAIEFFSPMLKGWKNNYVTTANADGVKLKHIKINGEIREDFDNEFLVKSFIKNGKLDFRTADDIPLLTLENGIYIVREKINEKDNTYKIYPEIIFKGKYEIFE